MLLRSLISLFVVSILAVQCSSQYVDLFQSLQNLFQPSPFDYREVTTRRSETRKHGHRHENIHPAIVFQDDDRPRSTSRPHSKPRKSRPNSSHTPTTKRPSAKQTQIPTGKLKNNRKIPELSLFNTDNIFFSDDEKGRRPNLNRNDEKPNRVSSGRNPDVTNAINKNINQNTISNWGNGYTTRNPLLSRPGVKPAPVDESRPPITNRPVDVGFVYPETATNADKDDEPELVIGPDEDDMSSAEKRQYMEVAEEMCENYKSLNVKKIVALPLVPSPQGVEFNVSDCTPINVPLIIGGTVSRIEEFPHMALVGWKMLQGNGYSWKCGGSLISDQYVLTAGHCTYQEKDYNVVSGPPHAVHLGSTYVNGPGAVVVKSSRVIRHPKYKQRRSYYDIALINLAKRVSFSDTIRPACLGVPPPVGEPIIATGWGRTEFGGDQSLELRSVSLPIWDMQDCRQIWGTSLKLPNGPSSDSQVCAGEKAGGKDTCQGDSGGPAQIQDGCAWRVVAVTSSGRSCGAQDTPALYAKVPRAFVAAQVFGKRALDNRYSSQNQNRNNQNRGNSNLNSQNSNNNVNSQNNWNSNQNNQNNRLNSNLNSQSMNNQQNTRDSNSQSNWNSNQNNQNNRVNSNLGSENTNNFQQNNRDNSQNIWNSNQNTRDSNINSQNWNTNQDNNYNQNNRNVYQDTTTIRNIWNTNQNFNNNQQNQNWNVNFNQQTNNQNNRNQNYNYNNNRYTHQSTKAYNQNNRNSYVTEGWNSEYNPVYDYNIGFGGTERPWFR